MNEPHDPGGTSPQVSNFVTIAYDNASGMETERSILDTDESDVSLRNAKRKRSTIKRICKHCNKKRKTGSKHSKTISENDCQCNNESTEFVQNSQQPPEHHSMLTEPQSLHNISIKAPNTSVARILYNASDASPYVIHVQRELTSTNDKNSIHPVAFGHFLKKHSYKNIVNGSIKRIGRNKISISFSHYEDANLFIENSTLKSNKYKAFIPSFNVTRMGIVRGVPADWSDEEVISNFSVPVGCGNILKIRRIKRKTMVNEKVDFVPTESVVLTFDGQILPKRVFLCYNSLPVDLYIFPTIQCFNCCRYGHIKNQCRSLPRCYKCTLDHCGDNCSVDEEYFKCCLCSGAHMATNKKCPEFFRQKNIKESMAKNCISYSESLKLHPPITKSYADVLSTPASQKDFLHVSNSPLNKNSENISYKKTVFLKPKPLPKTSRGYDRAAHEALLKEYAIPPVENGAALENNNITSLNELPLKDLIVILIQSLCQNNKILPSNAALFNNEINNNSNSNNGSSGSMELQKRMQ
jgi:hypothetical protein